MKYAFLTILILLPLIFAHGAEGAADCRSQAGGYCVNLAAIAGLEFLGDIPDEPGQLIARLYVFGMSLVGISALIVLVAGGIMYMTAGDNESRTAKARTFMGNAVLGLVLALLSYLILFTINPDLVRVGFPKLQEIGPAKVELSPEAKQAIEHIGGEQVLRETVGARTELDAKTFTDWLGNREKEQADRKKFREDCLSGGGTGIKETRKRARGGIIGSTDVTLICVK